MKIKISELEELITKILVTEYSSDDAVLIKDVLMFGELSEIPSDGIMRLLKENTGVFVTGERGKPEYERKTKVSTVIDAKGNPGMLAASLATNEVIKLAKENGIGIVGLKNCVNTTGSVSYYVEKIAKEDFIGIAFVRGTNTLLAPFGVKNRLFSTNPVAFGIPSNPKPLIFDMATAGITFGKAAQARIDKQPIPENVAVDSDGNMTTDPDKAIKGAFLPFDNGYKGSGLAMMVEILGSVWVGACYGGLHAEKGCGNLYMAMSPELLSDTESFKERVKELTETVKNSESRDGKAIRIPGERSATVREKNLQRGEVEISDATFAKIKEQYFSNK